MIKKLSNLAKFFELEEKVSALREKQDRLQSFAKIHSEKMDAERKKLSDQHAQ